MFFAKDSVTRSTDASVGLQSKTVRIETPAGKKHHVSNRIFRLMSTG